MQGFHERLAGHETCCLPCCGMMRAHRVRQTYDHRLRDAIAATGNTDLFRDVSIPASTRRTWARGDVRPVVASQIDATVIRLTTGIRIYLQAIIDNFSRRILAWRVSDKLSSATTRELPIEASEHVPGLAPKRACLSSPTAVQRISAR